MQESLDAKIISEVDSGFTLMSTIGIGAISKFDGSMSPFDIEAV